MTEKVRANPKAFIIDTRFVDCELIVEDDTSLQGTVFQNCKIHILESTVRSKDE